MVYLRGWIMHTITNLEVKDTTPHRLCNAMQRTLPLCSSPNPVSNHVNLHYLCTLKPQRLQLLKRGVYCEEPGTSVRL